MVGLSGCCGLAPCWGGARGLLGLETFEGTALCVLYPVLPHWFPFADLENNMEFFFKKCEWLLVAQWGCCPPWGRAPCSIAPAPQIGPCRGTAERQILLQIWCLEDSQSALNDGLVRGASDRWVVATASKMRTWPSFQAKTVTGTYRSLTHESSEEKCLLPSSSSFIANKLSYRVTLNSSKALESKMFKIVSRRAIKNVNFMAQPSATAYKVKTDAFLKRNLVDVSKW